MSSTLNPNPVRQILENIRFPERLDAHAWVNYRFVREAVAETPELAHKSPGYRLVMAVSRQFLKMMPNTPPKQGKRLDTRWGKFGILAAQYFAPFQFGVATPSSLQDAWGCIDAAILLFVFGKPAEALGANDISLYKLVGDEPGVAARSTISDWHINGTEQLSELILEYERHIEASEPALPAGLELAPEALPARKPRRRRGTGWAGWLIALLLLAALGLLGLKGWQIYQMALALQGDVSQLRSLSSAKPDMEAIKRAGPLLDKFRLDFGRLKQEVATPLRMFGPWLGWLPEYGPDVAAASDLLELADKLTSSAQITYQAVLPLVDEFQTSKMTAGDLTQTLLKVQPELLRAQDELTQAQTIRAGLEFSKLSPRTQNIVQDVDRVLGLMRDGLSVALTVPKILGASSDGPKTYMLLVQNEDELRPTGGFIGVVGSFVLRDGKPMGISFKDSYAFDDWTKPYPEAPWQLEEYMNIPALVLRDANWFTGFPISVSWIEYLYAYTDNHTVDGVIAIDQQSLVYLLEALGPIPVKGGAEPVTSGNIIKFMRDAKAPPAGEENPEKWILEHRKDFVGPLADAIMARLLSGEGVIWDKLARAMLRALDEQHILLQFDDPLVTDLLARYEWDGALRPGSGDFLMAVDSNVGINKANAVVDETLSYAVDLTDLEKPVGSLVIFHKNNASSAAICSEWNVGDKTAYPFYAIDRCYWDYLRVYLPKGTSLLEATPHFIPADGTVAGRSVKAKVDVLDMEYEEIGNASGFGTLLSVAGGETVSTSFKFLLPGSVVAADGRQRTYTLRIQKQPGTGATPVTIRIHLPSGVVVEQAPQGAIVQGSDILIETNLNRNVNISVVFSAP